MATNRIQIKERAIGLAMNAITFSDWKVDRNWKMSFYKSLFFFSRWNSFFLVLER
jgi:hypothetical protein